MCGWECVGVSFADILCLFFSIHIVCIYLIMYDNKDIIR